MILWEGSQEMNIPDLDFEKIKKYGKSLSVEEETILLRGDEKAKEAYYIVSGGIRLFFYTDDSEVTLEFFFENSIVSSFSSFREGVPSAYWLETIEKSELVAIPKAGINQLLTDFPDLSSLYIAGLEDRLSSYIKRLNTLLSHDAKERYNLLVRERPDIIQRVRQKYIASYIGIKPESLSRIRSSRNLN